MLTKRYKAIAAIILSIIYWRVFLFDIRVANDFPWISNGDLLDRFRLPQLWTIKGAVGMGEYAVSTLWSWPIDLLYGLGAKFGLTFPVLERLLGIFPFLLMGTFGISKLSSYLNIKNKIVTTVFYLGNTYILLLIDGGQFSIALSYAAFPLTYLAVRMAIEKSVLHKLVAALAVTMFGFFDIRFVYVLFVLLFVNFLYEMLFIGRHKRLTEAYKWLTAGLVIGIIFLGLNAYWILPAIIVKAPLLPPGYERVDQTSFLSFANVGHALMSLQPHWFRNVFGQIVQLKPEFFLIPIFFFLAPILRTKNKTVGFWLLVSIIGVFLVKGANPPFSGVYSWMFDNVPGFSLFRDPTKFYFLTLLSYSILFGMVADELGKRVKLSIKPLNIKVSAISFIFVLYFILLLHPLLLGKLTGVFSPPYNKKEFLDFSEVIQNDNSFGRVAYFPSRPPLGYSSPLHPSLEGARIVQKRPFASGVVGTYEFFNFVREASYVGELFKISGTSYLSFPYPDTRREDLKPDNISYYYMFWDQIKSKDWVGEIVSDPPIAALRVKDTMDHVFVVPRTWYVVGSDRIYNDLMAISEFDLSKNALIFAEEKPNQLENVLSEDDIKIISFEKDFLDVVASFIPDSDFIFPSQNLNFEPNEDGWWKREAMDFLWLRDFLHEKYNIDYQEFDYGGGIAIAEGEKKITIKDDRLKKGEVLLARIMNNSKGGEAVFVQGPKNTSVSTNKPCSAPRVLKLSGYKDIADREFVFDCADFFWVNVGKILEDGQITIEFKGDINLLNALVSLPYDELEKITNIISQKGVLYWEQLGDLEKESLFSSGDEESIDIYYERLEPTRYRVHISEVASPITLAFSETYDPLWKLDNQNSFQLYSLINGFRVNESGVYDLYFSPQKHVFAGLTISGATLVFVLAGIAFSLRKRR